MELYTTVADVRAGLADARRAGKSIGLVPTMGALHEGHLALIDASVRDCDVTVVSLFVNPLQFGPAEDFARYPRDLTADADQCRRRGAAILFAPGPEEMYPEGEPLTTVDVHTLTDGLCGRARPGHFRGVTTVVAKLFLITQPDKAYFGAKDYQQLAVIRRMVTDLNFPITIEGVPTVREADGLAMSSRNQYLAPDERRAAALIPQALREAEAAWDRGETDPKALRRAVSERLADAPLIRVDYIEVVDAHTLEPWSPQRRSAPGSARDEVPRDAVIALAVYIGATRLIDNVVLNKH